MNTHAPAQHPQNASPKTPEPPIITPHPRSTSQTREVTDISNSGCRPRKTLDLLVRYGITQTPIPCPYQPPSAAAPAPQSNRPPLLARRSPITRRATLPNRPSRVRTVNPSASSVPACAPPSMVLLRCIAATSAIAALLRTSQSTTPTQCESSSKPSPATTDSRPFPRCSPVSAESSVSLSRRRPPDGGSRSSQPTYL
jgi:hypothetical protein